MILITGAARSGTSMIAGIIDKCGAWGGKTSGPNRYNKKGMFENASIRRDITKTYFRSMGVDPKGQYPLPDVKKLKSYPDLKQHVIDVFEEQGWDRKTPLYYKGAKCCLVWPIWHRAFPGAKWIFVRRPDEQVIASCLRTSFMNAHKDIKGWQWWINQHKKRLQEMKEAKLHLVEVWSNKIAKDPIQARFIINWLGLEFNQEAVEDFVEPKLYSA